MRFSRLLIIYAILVAFGSVVAVKEADQVSDQITPTMETIAHALQGR